MSIRIMAKVWENGPSSQSERFVLLALADYANDAGECWPSIHGVAEKCCMSERGVRKIVRRLEESGWLETAVGGGRKGCNQYTINPEPRSAPEPRSPGTTFPAPRNHVPKNPEPRSPEPSVTINKPSERAPEEILSEVASADVASDFVAHRREMKKPITPRAASAMIKKLSGHPDPDAVLLESISNGWQGIFPDKVKPRAQKQSVDGKQNAGAFGMLPEVG